MEWWSNGCVGSRMDGQMDEQLDGQTVGWTDSWLEGWTNWWLDGCSDLIGQQITSALVRFTHGPVCPVLYCVWNITFLPGRTVSGWTTMFLLKKSWRKQSSLTVLIKSSRIFGRFKVSCFIILASLFHFYFYCNLYYEVCISWKFTVYCNCRELLRSSDHC